MKILAVRGKNLASLAGYFEVDFEAAPLDRAGLIAITGPTGAGKTTLLDAMCLALFDRTPRFANRGGVVIGGVPEDPGAGLRASDVRSILRHGAVEAWAEVDFRGVDERRWRARWEVRRARNRADGRIQAQQMQLMEIGDGGQIIAGDRKGDTLAAIEARLGLDFDQFRRSVLLAQGEFAAFLEASGGERAELLERMTGTWLYRELGRGAFERAKQAERELELIRREREQLRLLDDEQREALEQQAAQKAAERRELDARRTEAEAALRWYARHDELERALADARASLAAFEPERAALAETELLLARVEKATVVRERLAIVEQRRRELDDRRAELEFLAGELPLIEEQIIELRSRVSADEAALERARERRRRMAGELDRARALDTQLDAGTAARARLHAKLEQARAQHGAAQAQLDALEAGLADAQARLDTGRRWLDEHAGLAPLTEHWPHYRSLLAHQLRDLDARALAGRRMTELGPQLEQLEREQAATTQARDSLRTKRRNAQMRLRKVERELAALPGLTELRRRQDALDRCRKRLTRLQDIAAAHERTAATLLELEREQTDSIIERDHRVAERRRVERELEQTAQRYAEAQHGLRALEAVRDLAAHRAELVDGEPCPLCGATEHPSAHELAPVDAAIAGHRGRVEQLSHRRDELQREQGEHLGREQHASTRLVAIANRLRELGLARERAQDEWATAIVEGPLLPEPDGDAGSDGDPERPSEDAAPQLSLLGANSGPLVPRRLDDPQVGRALWSVGEQLDGRSLALARVRADVEAALDRQRDRQARWTEVSGALEDVATQLDALVRERDRVARELSEAQTRAADLDGEIEARWIELDDVLPPALTAIDAPRSAVHDDVDGEPGSSRERERWRARLQPELLGRLDAGVQRFAAQQRSCDQALDGMRTLDTGRAELRSSVHARREAVASLEAELREFDEAQATLGRERASLLDGRPVAELVRELEAALELAGRDRELSKDAQAKAEREQQAHRARALALEDQVAALQTSADEATRAADQARAEVGLAGELLDELLARSEPWTEAWQTRTRAELERGRAELARRRAVVDERERVWTEHRESGPPTLARELVLDGRRRHELDERGEQLRRASFEIEHQLRRDAENRAQAAALDPRLSACERDAEVWGRLRDAIGSATGDRFQKFAQSLTLELLLAQANASLRELKPRYALGRVPNHDLELQLVDHDHGDEIRSIRSLSGGEKFLVSLALALALASLSAEDCRIDSLFIDEGFGTLDAQTLDVAVSTLDALQADGRQIGVISHVPGLAERVGVEIRVEPVSSGRSRVRVLGVQTTAA